MSKCPDCRKNEALDTRWEKIKYWFLRRLFPIQLIEEKGSSFTQGFGDGYKVGRKDEKEAQEQVREMLESGVELPVYEKPPLPIVDLAKVVTAGKDGHSVFLNGNRVDAKKLEQLKSEVIMYKNTLLWDLLTNTLDSQAFERGWTKSKTIDDLVSGKAISETIDVQKKIIALIEKAK